MRKINKCDHCNSFFDEQFICDTCGDDLMKEHLGVPIVVDFGYGSNHDGETYHFCGLGCLKNFINRNE